MSKILTIFDFDNTLYDSAKRLKDLRPSYNPLKQTNYSLSKKNLELMSHQEFYSTNPQDFNLVVALHLLALLKTKDHDVLVISSSINDETHRKKEAILSSFVGTRMTIHREKDGEDVFEQIPNLSAYDKVIVVDDNPNRLSRAKKHGFELIVVKQPYNTKWHEGYEFFLPGYFGDYLTLKNHRHKMTSATREALLKLENELGETPTRNTFFEKMQLRDTVDYALKHDQPLAGVMNISKEDGKVAFSMVYNDKLRRLSFDNRDALHVWVIRRLQSLQSINSYGRFNGMEHLLLSLSDDKFFIEEILPHITK